MSVEATAVSAVLPQVPGLSGTRRRLFEVALELFGDQGYHGVSVRDLAKALGLQPGAIYTHVASKQQLLCELVTVGHRAHRDALKAALLDAGRDPADQVRALVRAHVLTHLEYSALARVSHREVRALAEDQLAAVLQVRRQSEEMFIDVIERGIRLGDFAVADPWLAVMAIGAMGVRAAEWWTPESDRTARHVADTYAAFAVRMLSDAAG